MMFVGSRMSAPGAIDGAGEFARKGDGDGEREGAEKSRPRVNERADVAGSVPVGEDEYGVGDAMGGGLKEK